MREALRAAPAPVVAVSPFVGGRAIKGPTEPFCEQAGIERSADGIARAYGEVIDGVVADEASGAPAGLVTDTLMDKRRRRAAGWPARCSTSRASLDGELGRLASAGRPRTLAILPVKSFGAAKQRLAPALGAGARRRWPGRCSATCSVAPARARSSTASWS